jgi:hypothetical protein
MLGRAESLGYLKGRIPKRYECYLEAKEAESKKYPKIVVAQCTTGKVIPKYIQEEISKIPSNDIAESYKQENSYPTVLIIGPRQYLRETEKQLRQAYPRVSYPVPSDTEYGIIDAYENILREQDSNLGWRILMELSYPLDGQKEILAKTTDGRPMVDLLEAAFVKTHLEALAGCGKIRFRC